MKVKPIKKSEMSESMTMSELKESVNKVIKLNQDRLNNNIDYTEEDEDFNIKGQFVNRIQLSDMLWKLILSQGLTDEERLYLISEMYLKEELYKQMSDKHFTDMFGFNRVQFSRHIFQIKRKLQMLWIQYYS